MTRVIRILLVVMVAAISVSGVISTAGASNNKVTAVTSAKKKGCKLPGTLGTIQDGEEMLEEDSPGYNSYTCSNGRVCATAHLSKGFSLRVCWYSPALVLTTGNLATAPNTALARTN
jgi:hypothetical protein